MMSESDRGGPGSDVAVVVAARDCLDGALVAYNHHSLLVERYR
jgi:hypothetical protein